MESIVLEGIESLDVGIGIFDAEERLIHCNRSYRDLRRYPEALCQPGTPLEAMIRFNAERGDFGPGDLEALVAERLAEIIQAGEREVERKMADGQILRIRYRRTPGGGRVISFKDCTAERRAEAALMASEERYALVSDAAEEAIYEWDIEGRRFYASPRLKSLLGRDHETDGSRQWDWDDIVHPDDIARYRDTLDAHLSGAVPRWNCEYRLKDAAGVWRWVRDHGTSVRGPGGEAQRMVAAIRDITERVEKDAALAASEERHALIVQATSDGIYDWNVAEGRLYVSERLSRDLGFDASAGPAGWFARVHPDDRSSYAEATRKHMKAETATLDIEYRAKIGGVYRWIHDSAVGQRGPDGRVVRLVGAMRDITEIKGARAEIERTEARLSSALATISDGLLLVDSENRVQLWNDRYVEIFSEAAGGADLSAVIFKDRPFFDMIRDGYNLGMFKPHPDGVDAWVKARAKAWSQPASQWELELANGTWILLNESETHEGGRVSVYTDITELKRRESDAQASRERFEEAIESISSGFVLFDAEDRLVNCNSRYCEYFPDLADLVAPGTPFADIIRAGIDRGLFPGADQNPEAFVAATLRKRARASGEFREQHLAGDVWLQISDHRTRDGGIVSIYTDVTELKNREAEIRKQSAILELTLENMGQGISMVDKDLRTMAFNKRFLEMFEFPEEEFGPGFSMEQAFRYNANRGEYGPGDIEEQVRERMELSRKFLAHRFERTRPDGTVIEIVGNPIEGGGFVSTYTDITERKRADEALKAALDEFNAVLDHIDYGVIFMGPDLRARIVSRAMRSLWSFTDELIESRPTMRDLMEFNRHSGAYDVAAADWDVWAETRVEAVRKGGMKPIEMRRADGKVLAYQCVDLPDGGRMLTYFDITELKRAETVARDSETRLRGVLENSPIGVAVIRDTDNMILFHNARFPEVLRGPGENLVGTSSTRFWTDLEERARAREIFERDGRVVNREVKYHGLDGSDVWSLSTYERANWEGEPSRLIWLFDITREKANREALVVARDEAEAALADLQRAQTRLVQAEKMASLGQLTAGIAHEIKNPLNFVNNFAKLSDELLGELSEILDAPIKALDADIRDDAEDLLQTVRENLGKINQHGRRADSIVKNMLLHSREGPSERQLVNLNLIAEEALNLAYHGARAENPKFNIEMKKVLDPEVGRVECFPQDLMRVFLNLITNGMYAANERLAESGGAPSEIALTTRLIGDRVEIEVRDNGTGVPADMREKIFNPFFTTKPAGEGTGLGLSLSYDIVVKQHGGELTLESEPGVFSAFQVTVPRHLPATKRGLK